MMTVGLVIVTHSGRLADGVVELAAQMAPDVRIRAAGGLRQGGVGTDFELVSAALSDAETGSGVAMLYDLGSAQMTAELAVEALADPSTARVVDAPLVEGTVAAAVAAQGGQNLDAVARAAGTASADTAAPQTAAEASVSAQSERIQEEIVLRNEVGLHARPAALLARTLTGLEADVTITMGDEEVDAASVLAVMGLGARQGDRVLLQASGPDAREVIDRIRDLVARDFDE